MSPARVPTAILISGRGSNMMSLVQASRQPDYPAEIVAVVSNRPAAAGLEWARAEGIPTAAVNHRDYDSREAFEAELHKVIAGFGAELIAQAGFLRILTDSFVQKWENRILNIHPSLLPSFKGLHAHEQALEAGVRISGCTVHFVIAEMDAGPIVAQAAVPVREGDTPDSLSDRILAAEHKLYPAALAQVAGGLARVSSGRVANQTTVNQSDVLFSPKAG